jgi:hypothetical protein
MITHYNTRLLFYLEKEKDIYYRNNKIILWGYNYIIYRRNSLSLEHQGVQGDTT